MTMHRLLARARAPWAACACAAALAAGLAIAAWSPTPAMPDQGLRTSSSALGGAAQAGAQGATRRSGKLDVLRAEAAMGRPDALTALTRLLVASYDETGDERALTEATLWFERQWNAGDEDFSALAGLLTARQCLHSVLQWHRLCEMGE